jgi:hypothetical protein
VSRSAPVSVSETVPETVSVLASLSLSTYPVDASKFLFSKDPNFLKFSLAAQALILAQEIKYDVIRTQYETVKS